MNRYLTAACLLLVSTGGLADLQLEIQDISGRATTLSSNGSKTRIETQGMPGYAVVDHASGEMLLVDPRRGKVLSATPGAGGVIVGGDSLSVSLLPRGGGRKIAGYETRKYELVANGESCGTIYASQKLMEVEPIRAMHDAMRGMRDISTAMSAVVGGLLTACQRANMQLSDVVDSAGMPLLVLDAGGNPLTEVLSVDRDARIDAGDYEVPPGMEVVPMDQAMRQASELMQNMPDMKQIMQQMQQMQQGGQQMTPEMSQQMEKMQEMLDQLQRQ